MEKEVKQIGVKVPDDEKVDIFPAPEGECNMYYGRIGSGKTYGATADIHELLAQGRVVYATWPIKVSSFDDRKSLFMLIKGLFFMKNYFYDIPCQENFHFIDADKGEVDGEPLFDPTRPSAYADFLNKINHADLFIDEAWRFIDSYRGTDISLAVRDLILVTRHKFRTVNVIAQRPTSVHVIARGNMNRFYKFVAKKSFLGIHFQRFEFQDMDKENVDESQEPISVKTYWGRKKIFESYNSYFYGDLDRLHAFNFDVYYVNFREKLRAIGGLFKGYFEVIHSFFHNLVEKMKLTKPQNNTKIKSNLPF